MANRVGEQLGKYRLVRLLGRGSFAEVYLGEHLHLKTEAAVKVLHGQLAEDDAESFLKEAQTIARLVHPHIVRIFDFDVQEGTPFLVMDYAPNGTLRQRHPKRMPLPQQRIVQYVKHIAGALQFAHDQKLIHRDVKPENMLIGRNNEILLSDFGTVQVAQSTHVEGEGTRKIAGTLAYMSPEQLQGRARPASDQYALGIVVYEWLSGERPFQGAFGAMAGQHLFTPPAPLHEKIPAIPPAVDEVVMIALAKDPKQRFESVQAFANALERVCFPNASPASPMIYTPPAVILPRPSAAPIVVRQPSQVPQPQSPVSDPSPPAVTPVITDQPAWAPQQLPSGSNPPLPALVPTGGVQPAQVQQPSPAGTVPYQPIGTDPARLRGQRGWKKSGRNVLLAVLVALIIIAGSSIAYFAFPKKPSPGPHPGLGIGVTKAPDSEYIGLSDGTFAFDTTRPDGTFKMQAADKLKKHDIKGAEVLWQAALAVPQESNDAEALIYLEDQRVLASSHPYVTFVVGTVLTGDAAETGREDLQGAYVAQKEYNDGLKLPGGMRVRLLIANSGNQSESANVVAQQVMHAAQVDKTIVGVMGWPFSGTSRNAISVLAVAHIPMVSPTASFDFLTGISPYFLRVTPSNKRQVVVGVQYAEHTLHATRAALFVDPADTYSKEVGIDFEQQFVTDGNNVVATEDYTVRRPEILQGLLQDALKHNPDLIYFAGYANDVGALLTDLPTSGNFAHLQVLGSDLLSGSYPSSASAELKRLHFTAFADVRTWDFLGLTAREPNFFNEYPQDFDPHKRHVGDPYGYTRANIDAMFSYDAMLALLTGSNFALSSGEKSFSSNDLQRALTKIAGSQAIQGVTGQISLGPDGDPVNKAVVLQYVDANGNVEMESVLGGFLVGS